MAHRSAPALLLAVISVLSTAPACSSSDGGSEAGSTTTPTASATEAATTGTASSDPTTNPTTGVDPSTGVATTEPTTAPTTAPTTEPPGGTSTGEPGTTPGGEASSDPSVGTTGSGTTGGESTGGSLTASAVLEPKSGSQVTGTVLFSDLGGGTVDLVITLANVEPPGTHALHIHEIPDCSAPDGNSTGPHWNPPPTMLGELGTVEIADDGTGVFMKSDLWSIGTGADNDVVNHSIIIHAEAGGGTRIACGVIAKD